MSYSSEFQTIDILLKSDAETRGVDAFALSVIKAERQIRKIFTYLVFQFPSFTPSDFVSFRRVLGENKKVYFQGFIKGIDSLYPKTVKDMIGVEYDFLLTKLDDAITYRNKIFHGQLTDKHLTRPDLLRIVEEIRKWCKTLSVRAKSEFDFDGFERNSLQKNPKPIWKNYRIPIENLEGYRAFIREHLQQK